MMASRKSILDKNKQQLLDSVNASNKVYTNEELSILIGEQKELITSLQQELGSYKISNDQKIIDILSKDNGNIKEFTLRKYITGNNGSTNDVIIKNIKEEVMVEVKVYGSFNHINYGGYVIYRMGALLVNNKLYGVGDVGERKGELGNYVGPMYSTYTGTTLTIRIPFTTTAAGNLGSNVQFDVTVQGRPEFIGNVTATMN